MTEEHSSEPTPPRHVAHEVALFLGVGAFSYLLGAGIAAGGRELLGLNAEVAVAISLAVLILVNFWLNRVLVFRGQGPARHEFVKFAAASVTMRGCEYLMFLALLKFAHLHYLAAYTTALLISNAAKFLLYRTLVFRRMQPAASARRA